jgi:DNA-binding NtrC family response regulator
MLPLNRQTVLLIEADTSLRRLIALGLQYRGMRVIEASSPTNIPSFTMEAQPPSLIVLDIDGEAGSDHSLLSLTQANPSLSALPTIVLAWECLVPVGAAQGSPQMQVTCLTKPFDARTLHATIEQFFEKAVEQEAAAIPAQEMVAMSRSESTTPSIWPLVTAAGLLLAFIGLMIQITVTALGLLIVIVALLWWTLGSKTEQKRVPVGVGNT